jgi:hypothetical protein
MKSPMQIFKAVAMAFLCPRCGPCGPSPETHVVWIVLFLIGRLIVAASLVPAVLITGMASDSGTELAGKGAIALMYSMSFIVWAVLLWSWRCAVAWICLVVSVWLLLVVFDGKDQILWLLTPSLQLLCFGITEALPAPIRTTWRFLVWCSTNDDQGGVGNISEKEMSPLSLV